MTQGRLLVENTSELRQEQNWRWGRNPKEGKWLRAQPLESDGPPTSLPLSRGFLLWKMDFRETLSKIMNVKYLIWYWAHGKCFCSIIIAIIILNWVLKKQNSRSLIVVERHSSQKEQLLL